MIDQYVIQTKKLPAQKGVISSLPHSEEDFWRVIQWWNESSAGMMACHVSTKLTRGFIANVLARDRRLLERLGIDPDVDFFMRKKKGLFPTKQYLNKLYCCFEMLEYSDLELEGEYSVSFILDIFKVNKWSGAALSLGGLRKSSKVPYRFFKKPQDFVTGFYDNRKPTAIMSREKAKEILKLWRTGKYTKQQLMEIFGCSRFVLGVVLKGMYRGNMFQRYYSSRVIYEGAKNEGE